MKTNLNKLLADKEYIPTKDSPEWEQYKDYHIIKSENCPEVKYDIASLKEVAKKVLPLYIENEHQLPTIFNTDYVKIYALYNDNSYIITTTTYSVRYATIRYIMEELKINDEMLNCIGDDFTIELLEIVNSKLKININHRKQMYEDMYADKYKDKIDSYQFNKMYSIYKELINVHPLKKQQNQPELYISILYSDTLKKAIIHQTKYDPTTVPITDIITELKAHNSLLLDYALYNTSFNIQLLEKYTKINELDSYFIHDKHMINSKDKYELYNNDYLIYCNNNMYYKNISNIIKLKQQLFLKIQTEIVKQSDLDNTQYSNGIIFQLKNTNNDKLYIRYSKQSIKEAILNLYTTAETSLKTNKIQLLLKTVPFDDYEIKILKIILDKDASKLKLINNRLIKQYNTVSEGYNEVKKSTQKVYWNHWNKHKK